MASNHYWAQGWKDHSWLHFPLGEALLRAEKTQRNAKAGEIWKTTLRQKKKTAKISKPIRHGCLVLIVFNLYWE